MDIEVDILIAQVINFLIIFFLFKKFLGDSLIKLVEERRELIKKLKDADHQYEKIINNARTTAESIVSKAKNKANEALKEGENILKLQNKVLVEEWERKAEMIIKNAENEAKKIENNLIKNWTNSLKETSKLLVKKILWSDEKLQDKYLDNLISDLKK